MSLAPTTSATNGKQNETWAMVMEPRLNGQIKSLGQGMTRVKNSSMETPMQISGTTMGSVKAPSTRRLADEAVAPQQNRRERADDERDDRGDEGDGQRIGKGDQQGLVVEELLVVIEGEAAPDDVALAVVETEGDQRDERRVKEEEHGEQPEAHLPRAIIFERGASQGHGLDPVNVRAALPRLK